MSLRRRSQALGNSVTSLWPILRNDLGLHCYKIKLTQELKPLDHQKRRMFVNEAEQQREHDSEFYRNIMFSNEAHFWLTMRYCQTAIHRYSLSHHCIPQKLRFIYPKTQTYSNTTSDKSIYFVRLIGPILDKSNPQR